MPTSSSLSSLVPGLATRLEGSACSRHDRLWITALGSASITAALILGGQALRRRAVRAKLKRDPEAVRKTSSDVDPEDTEKPLTTYGTSQPRGKQRKARQNNSQHNEELIAEQLARNIAFLGEAGNKEVRNAFVIVVGLGGVGSSASTMLARSGIGKLRLIDFDQVTLSSLNRHATATRRDVGIPKVESCKNFFEDIAPWVEVDARAEQFTLEDAPRLLAGRPDWVLDCIDNTATKCDLLTFCKQNGLKVFSALGAASKADPSRVQIADISNTFEDPLARSVRRRLKLAGIMDGVPVVYSTERPGENVRLLPLPEEEFQKGSVGELAALASFRVRILPVLGPLPAMFGQAMAAHVLALLAKFPTKPLAVKNRHKVYHKVFCDLVAREAQAHGEGPTGLSEEDAGYVFEELHRGRSVVAPTFSTSPTPAMLRWRPDLPLTLDNLVVMTRDEARKHEEEVNAKGRDPEEVWGSETARIVQERQREEAIM